MKDPEFEMFVRHTDADIKWASGHLRPKFWAEYELHMVV